MSLFRALLPLVSALVIAIAATGCTASRQMFAGSSDYNDYRAFRAAAHPGRRLELGELYMGRHPQGQWAGEVAEAFRAEEQAYFESARATLEGARDYLAFLPRGPHASEMHGFLAAFRDRQGDVRDEQWLSAARATESMLSAWAEDRRVANEVVFDALSVMLSPAIERASAGEAAAVFSRVGGRGRTWGIGSSEHRELRFRVPTGAAFVARRLAFDLDAAFTEGRVTSLTLRGPHWFMRWCEAVRLVALDPRKVEDQLEASLFAVEMLGAAAEARFPKRSCAREAGGESVVLRRSCEGRTFIAERLEGGIDEVRILFPGHSRTL